MKALILLVALLSSTAFASVSGDKIHFQKHSTWVSAAFSKSLCLDGETYHSKIRKCFEWNRDDDDKRTCVDYRIIDATQPMKSTRQRCANYSSDNDGGNCTEWITVPYIQSPVRTVTFYRHNDDNDVDRVEIITVPACN
jgi:hypothetical protein